jgi:hypothetical protein
MKGLQQGFKTIRHTKKGKVVRSRYITGKAPLDEGSPVAKAWPWLMKKESKR